MSETDGKFVNTLLSEQQLADFEGIKSYHGITNSSEMVRFLIRKEARQIQESAPLFVPANGNGA